MIKFLQFFFAGALLSLSLFLTWASAQPSGGPYGPIKQRYELPSGANRIYYVAVDGKSEASGEALTSPTSLESAIERVRTGDAIIMRGGVYRTGNLVLNQGITIQPYEDEEPVLKGSFVAADWQNLGNGLWVTKWSHLFPSKPDNWWQRDREGKKTPLYLFNNDMVFVDGRFLQAVGWEGEVDQNTYYIDYDSGMVYIGADPKDRLVEITAFNVGILRTTSEVHGKKSDHQGYTIRGVTFTQYAYRALEIEGTDPAALSEESAHGKDVVGSLLENCTITFCSRVAGYFRGDRFTMRHCKVSDTSTEGVYVIGSNDILLEGNIFTRNNIEHITGYYPAAVKIFNQCYRATCRNNLIIDLPNSNGIWYDVGEVDGVFVDNWVENVGHVEATTSTEQAWPSDNGFFFEISKGVVCAGNVFVNCDHGMMILNSSNTRIYNNTFVNSMACIGRNGRVPAGDHFGWHSSTGPGVEKREGHVFVNNLLTGDKNFTRPLLFVWQPASLCERLSKPALSQFDHNIFERGIEKTPYPLIVWSPAQNAKCQTGFNSVDSLRAVYPEFEANSRYYLNYDGPSFKSVQLNNYQLIPGAPGATSGGQTPEEIRKLIGQEKKSERYVGAFPPMQ
ncbi:MAG TPA: right-handed parallel beta-helix repeat-containing protein [Bacteroidota bacterium]|nr:right-handed parallel beta-helix repeat-containing protein [Bacteroidota bacterium]